MSQATLTDDVLEAGCIPWAVQLRGYSWEEPERLLQTLTGAILGCGGWVLSRGASDTGTVTLSFEFERRICVDVYSLLVATGVELTRCGHFRFTELCQCTSLFPRELGHEIVSVDLEIQVVRGASLLESAQICA